jgi:hypothetical protein
MGGVRLEGNSGVLADVDANLNLKINLPTTLAQAGYASAMFETDAGVRTGVKAMRSPYVSVNRRLSNGRDSTVFNYGFNATAQDTGVWKCAFTTQTITQGGGSVLFNANSTLTTTTYCSLSTWKYFNLLDGAPLRVSATLLQSLSNIPANAVFEAGLFLPVANAAPADGVFFRFTSAGVAGVITFNGVETTTGIILADGQVAANSADRWDIIVGQQYCEFWFDNNLLGTLNTPSGNGTPFLTQALPFTLCERNPGAVTGATCQWKCTNVHVDQIDIEIGMSAPHLASVMGLMPSQGASGGTMGSASNYANNLAAGAGAVMTNTTAALGTGLGGQFSALPTLAAGTDGILCSYQNPAGGINQTPRTFVCTGIKLQGVVTTVLAGNATPVVYAFSLAYGHTAVSMATAESGSFVTATAKAPRRIPIGFESFGAAAALGTLGSTGGVMISFAAPIAINPGEFIAICAKNLGVVTTTGVVTYAVAFDGYWAPT